MKRLVVFTALFFAIFAPVCHAELVPNGSFEDGTYTDNGFGYMTVTGTSILGWTANNVDWIGGLWGAFQGTKSIDLNGSNAAGSISRLITTLPDTNYVLSFELAGNPFRDDAYPTNKTLNVLIGGVSKGFSFEAKDHSSTDMGWVQETLSFTASSGSTTLLEFVSTTTGSSGPAIDYVTVTAVVGVPEPSIVYLLACGLTGLLVVRRKMSS